MTKSREHLSAVNETYFEHFGNATHFGCAMIAAGVACLVHGLLPGMFSNTGSRTIDRLHRAMVTHRIVNQPAKQSNAPQGAR